MAFVAGLAVDPWDEASALDAMTDGAARKRLGALLARFNDVPSSISRTGEVVSDLVARLPRQTSAARPVDGGGPKLTLPSFGAPIYWIVTAAIFVTWFAAIAQGH